MTNPRANIHLMWSCLKDLDIEEQLKKVHPDIVSDKNLSVPEAGTRYYGLYKVFSVMAPATAPIMNFASCILE